MKDLRIDENTTLTAPDNDGDVEIDMWTEESGNNSVWVSFEKLEKWVAVIRGQIIKSSNEQANGCPVCKNWDNSKGRICSNCHRELPPVG